MEILIFSSCLPMDQLANPILEMILDPQEGADVGSIGGQGVGGPAHLSPLLRRLGRKGLTQESVAAQTLHISKKHLSSGLALGWLLGERALSPWDVLLD